jgi:hypothetical protein
MESSNKHYKSEPGRKFLQEEKVFESNKAIMTMGGGADNGRIHLRQ